jgi:hypothetical protein
VSEVEETLRKMADELDLSRVLNELAAQAETWVKQAVEGAATFAHDHRDEASQALDRIASTIDAGTDGKYADQVARLRDQVELGLARFADQRIDGADGTDTD